MSKNRKRMFAVALFLGALAVWIPQIFGRSGSQPGDAYLDAELESSAELGPGLRLYSGGRPQRADGSAPAPAAAELTRPVADLPEAPSGTPGPPMQNFGGSSRDELLERLANAWGEVSSLEGGQRGLSAPDGSAGGSAALALEDFLARNPLGGILRAPDRSMALFGSRVVREGEELVPGRVLVQRIQRRHVELEADGELLRVELPSVSARAVPPAQPEPASGRQRAPSAGERAPGPEPVEMGETP